MPPRKRQTRKPSDVEPTKRWIPLLDESEIPSAQHVADLMHAVLHGLGLEGASAYANIPSPFVRNWLARGRKQEEEPFCPDLYADKEIRDHHVERHKKITMPCFILWMTWRKTRAQFLMGCVKKIIRSKDWKAQAWILERTDPSTYVKPNAPSALKRELLPFEKEVEADVVTDTDPTDAVQIQLPDNCRSIA